jgi:TIR domain
MNHGRLGYITRNKLRLPPHTLDQFGLREGNILFGIYYPRDFSDPNYGDGTVDDDFMLSPLFPPLWGRAGCFIIKLKHKPGSLAKIARFLADRNLSIYCSECTRSAYRYASWNLHVVATGLPEILDYLPQKGGYPKVIEHLEKVRDELAAICRDELFVDFRGVEQEPSVKLLHLSALAYFANYLISSKDKGLLFQPFSLKVGREGFLDDHKKEFARVLNEIWEQRKRDLNGKVFFAEADRRNYNMRLAVFPSDRSKNLFIATANYTSRGPWNTFRGLIARVAEALPRTCNIWKCSNEKLDVDAGLEKGRLRMVIENKDLGIPAKEMLKAIRDAFVRTNEQLAINTGVDSPRIQKASITYCKQRIDDDLAREKADKPLVFISYPSAEREKAIELCRALERKGVQGWVDDKEIGGGKWLAEVKRALNLASELILIWTPECMNSEWVRLEWNAAIVADINITIFLVDGKATSLPQTLKDFQAKPYADLRWRNKAIKGIADRMKSHSVGM